MKADGTTPTKSASTERLRRSRVLIVGVGGLGAPAAIELAAVGVGTIGLIDGDVIEISNLQRQIIYRSGDIGRSKVESAARRLRKSNPNVSVEAFEERLTEGNVAKTFAGFDFIIDGTDGAESKFLVNDGAVTAGKPFSHAGVVGFQAQTFTILPRQTACLRCLFPTQPGDDEVPTCRTAGVLGALVGTLGVIQAAEAVKYLLGIGSLLTDRLLTCDAWRQRWRCIAISRNPHCPACSAAH